ncbi:MAG: hypothetical protein CO186_10645 [Zetaproteobacteria bacterium CG_4_9_14_3_um_filter_49_83]|nr:MAG: hypothetical protein AUJ56_09465 [Zetaproteobacteria bacterium CG1_02_49_23]PIQ30681.1 MAG: hypothetical protein COW62_11600 [Zetaproteobacteria bacterium CG17_big_fil_post_rev_8_21_14_2_50_50_13]PIV30906.1 MAG: hypothetical protein COS35_04165 [Zetaproteobacteria bacterium CG02_land_8_20_14_3_00_50_9]PIY57172.1 MAG: hypothetical protein COZ00_00280 [Zetaproteobacteria bacterium CG_4_10_14_0_8_um_filter_49_80]PJA34447.1 MAG: hypothetical protein CO186_10645 [Zetaproteobacteria bacterium
MGLNSDQLLLINDSPLDADGGVDLLIQAIAMLRVDCPQVLCALSGSGALLLPLQRLCRWLDVEAHVRFIAGHELDGYAAQGCAYVTASRSEAMMRQQLQWANTHGLPFIALRQPFFSADAYAMLRWNKINACSDHADPESLALLLQSCCCVWLQQPHDQQALQQQAQDYFSLQGVGG